MHVGHMQVTHSEEMKSREGEAAASQFAHDLLQSQENRYMSC